MGYHTRPVKDPTADNRWLPNFGRTLTYLRPHKRHMVLGLIAALGVSVFYTFSVSSVIPLLKVIFAQNEGLIDWMHRVEVERRLDVVIGADLPNDPAGLEVDHVRDDSRSAAILKAGDRIVAIDGEVYPAYEVMKRLAQHPDKELPGVTIEHADTSRETVELKLRRYHWWSSTLRQIALILPSGKDPDSRMKSLLIVMGLVVALSLLGGLCRFFNEGLVAIAVQRGMHDVRTHLAEHVLHLPMQWHTRQPPGDTLGRFATDMNKVETGISTLFGKVIREPLKAVGVFTLALMIDWRMLVIAVVGLPIGAIAINGFGRLVKRSQRRASQSWGRLLDQLGERLDGIRVVKGYNMQDVETERFEEEGRLLTRAQSQIELVDAGTKPVLETLAAVAVAGFIIFGGSRVFSGQLEPNLFFATVVCLGALFDPLRKMGNVYNRIQAAEASAKRLFELMDLPPEEPLDEQTGEPLDAVRERIEFRGVGFAYSTGGGPFILRGIDLTVEAGQVLAIVGPNGAGKTTLMSLLMRFYEVTEGAILVDGRDIRDIPLRSLREHIGLVTQDAVVFTDTVRANIAYGANGVDDASVRRAAKLAHVDDFVRELRQEQGRESRVGYDAVISSRTLSGGQRQRIALARAILRDPPILVLDEATSQVDSESESRIQEALEDVTRGRTTFIIAHRFSTISRADRIIVMNEGRIVDTGRHDELLDRCPFYVSLCRTQFAHAE